MKDRREPHWPQPRSPDDDPSPRIFTRPPERPPGGGAPLKRRRDDAAPRRQEPRYDDEGGGRWWPWLLGVVGLLLLVPAGLAAYLYVAAPLDLIRDELVRQVKSTTGRDLTIAETPQLSLYPDVTIRLAGIALSAPPGMRRAPTIAAEAIEAKVQLWPLFSQQVVVDRIVLRKPVIDLAVDKSGRRSWEFAASGVGSPVGAAPRIRLAQAATGRTNDTPPELEMFKKGASTNSREAAGGGVGTGAATTSATPAPSASTTAVRPSSKVPVALTAEDIRIERGVVRYTDERSGLTETASDIDAKLALKGLAAPAMAQGALAWRGERLSFDVNAATLAGLMDATPTPLSFRIAGRPVTAQFKGSVTGAVIDGRVDAETPSVARLAAWSAKAGAGLEGLGGAAVAGTLKLNGPDIRLDNAKLALGRHRASGSIAVRTAGQRPLITAALEMPELDLNEIMNADGVAPSLGGIAPSAVVPAAAAQTPPKPAASHSAKGAAASPTGDGPRSIEDLLRRQGVSGAQGAPLSPPATPQVRGYEGRAGWSDQPFDLAPLGLADANVRLTVGKARQGAVKIGRSVVRVTLSGRNLRADLDEVQLYDGTAKGMVTLAPQAAGDASLSTNLTVDGVSALPLLKDAAGLDMLAGKGRIVLALTGQGASQQAIASSLAGKAQVRFADGQIVGYNVAQMLRGLSQGRFSGFERVPTEATDFSEAQASFAVAAGVAQTSDVSLVSPLLRVSGSGAIDVGKRQLDLVMRPKVVGTLAGQGGAMNLTGLEVPVKITGSFDDPRVRPDLAGVFKNPEALVDTARQLGQQLQKGEGLSDALKGITGGAKPKQLLEQFLKQ